jgi:hypothetical protein
MASCEKESDFARSVVGRDGDNRMLMRSIQLSLSRGE